MDQPGTADLVEEFAIDDTRYINKVMLSVTNEEAFFTLGSADPIQKKVTFTYRYALSINHFMRLVEVMTRARDELVARGVVEVAVESEGE